MSDDKFGITRRDVNVGNSYFNNEKIVNLLTDLGYKQIETGTYVDGLPVKFYLPENNSAIIVTNKKGYLFDNKTLRT